jgi:hypothetical protein
MLQDGLGSVRGVTDMSATVATERTTANMVCLIRP